MRRFPLLMVLVVAVTALPAWGSGGSGERAAPAERGPLSVHLVLKPEESGNSMFLERWLLPSSVSALGWTDFALAGSGEVELAAAGGYRISSHKPLSEESLGPIGIYSYSVAVSWSQQPAQGARKTFSLSFNYSARDSEGVILQPAQRALLEGIRRSGKERGSARVLELTYLGGGRFRAKVGVR